MDNISSTELDEILLKEKIPRSQCLVDELGVGFGLVKDLTGVKGFVANGRPIIPEKETATDKVQHNYKNLKAQCWFELANYVNGGLIGVTRTISIEARNLLIEDLEQMKQKDPGKDAPLQVLTKEDIKENIGRSTDVGDMFMMRIMYELRKPMAFGFLQPKPGPTKQEIKTSEEKTKQEREEFERQIKEGKVSMAPTTRGRKEQLIKQQYLNNP